VEEATLVETDAGLEPTGSGWFVLNAREARWLEGHFGAYTRHGAGVTGETREPKEAYTGLPPDQPVGYRDGGL